MASLFIVPLFKVVDLSLPDEEIVSFLTKSESVKSFDFTRNRNAVTIRFSAIETGQSVADRLQSAFPELVVKLSESKGDTVQLPVRWDDSAVPSGLHVVSGWISSEQELILMNQIDSLPWDMTIRRRVQHYGFQFKYSELNVGDSAVTDFPPIVKDMILSHDELKRFDFNQLTINEYVSGIGIASHCDTHSAFTDTIAVVSLLNPIVMDFVSHDNAKKVSVIIPPRSLMLMSGESRYGWRHAIASRKTDLSLDGTPAARERRVSLTFRRIQKCTCECPFASLCDSQGADFLRPRRMQSG